MTFNKSEFKKLYLSLGKTKKEASQKLFEILEDFYSELSKDLLIGFFFDEKDLKRISQKQGQFLLKAMGVNRTYSGKAPATAHLNLPPILKGHFDRRLQILKQTLKKHDLSEKHIKLWIEFENLFRASVQK